MPILVKGHDIRSGYGWYRCEWVKSWQGFYVFSRQGCQSFCLQVDSPTSKLPTRFFSNLLGKQKLVQKIGNSKKSWVKLQRLTEEGKQLLVRLIGRVKNWDSSQFDYVQLLESTTYRSSASCALSDFFW